MAYNKETGLYEGYIYCLTNRVNYKKYIGQTKNDVQTRVFQHFTSSKHYAISNAIRKYGKANFIVEQLIKVISDSEDKLINQLNKEEIFCIYWYETLCSQHGYNIDEGGGQATYFMKSVDQYDLCGNYINTYKSMMEADNKTNTPFYNISDVCNGRTNTANGYLWRFHGEKLTLPDIIPNRPVDQYDLNGVLIKTYKNLKTISDNKSLLNAVEGCCKKGRPYNVNGFVYRYPPDKFDKFPVESPYFKQRRINKEIKLKEKQLRASEREKFFNEKHKIPYTDKYKHYEITSTRKYNNIKIDEYNVFGELIQTYSDVYEISFKNNVDVNRIIKVCDGITGSLENHIYRYHQDPFGKYPIYIYGYDQYDMDLNYIRRWESSKECEEYYGFSRGSVNKACLRKSSLFGFVFVKHGETPYIPKSTKKKVKIYSIDNNQFISEYPSITAALKSFGLDIKNVGDVIRKLSKNNYVYYGYKWEIDDGNYKKKGVRLCQKNA